MDWEITFTEAIKRGLITQVINTFKLLCTDHASTPKQADKSRAILIIKNIYKLDELRLYRIAVDLANSSDETCEEIGLILLAEKYHINPFEVCHILYHLSDSRNWEVREWAASACSIVLSNHFDEFIHEMNKWVRDESPNVRRCVAVTVKYVSKQKKAEFFEGLIGLIQPLLFDIDPYVKKNLGAFAIGDGLLKYYPDKTIERMKEWIKISDERVRSNIAMVFTSAIGVKNYEYLEEIFNELKQDERAIVKKAVKQATTNLTKRLPHYKEGII